jgi:toxin ParE1/3/4
VAYRLRFAGQAVREIGEAFDWYEEQSEGLGSEFELAFELQLKRLEQVPLLYAEIVPGVRRTLLPRFPYGVLTGQKRTGLRFGRDSQCAQSAAVATETRSLTGSVHRS